VYPKQKKSLPISPRSFCSPKRQRAIGTPLRVWHPQHTHRRSKLNIRHILRRDQNILLPIRSVGSVDHHLHTDTTVDGVHEHIEFIWGKVRMSCRIGEGNLPRHRRGHPIHSHKERSRQIVEKDFSPPLNERGSLSRAFP
jgi:hypothetical protein